MELRCPSRIHVVVEDGKIKAKCSSKHCGARSGVAVFHYFDQATGALIGTKKFKDPKKLFDTESNQPERTN